MDACEFAAPPEIVTALRDGKRSGGWIRAYCPMCDPDRRHRDGGTLAAGILSSGPRKGRPWWGCHRCQCEKDFAEARKTAVFRAEFERGTTREDERRRKAKALEVVERSSEIRSDDLVDRYLRETRGLVPLGPCWPTDLRRGNLVHPETRQQHVCMVAIVRDVSGTIVGCHRTFLFELDDEAVAMRLNRRPPIPTFGRVVKINELGVPRRYAHPNSKLSLGPISGCAIRLGVDSEAIAIAEGIESALGLGLETQLPSWAAISAGNLARLLVPQHVKRVIIGPDLGDKIPKHRPNAIAGVGMLSAEQLRRRLVEDAKKHGIVKTISIKTPPLGHKDWGGRIAR